MQNLQRIFFSEVCHLDIENRGIRLVFEKKKMWSLTFLTV